MRRRTGISLPQITQVSADKKFSRELTRIKTTQDLLARG